MIIYIYISQLNFMLLSKTGFGGQIIKFNVDVQIAS